jgi:hypothetical protein
MASLLALKSLPALSVNSSEAIKLMGLRVIAPVLLSKTSPLAKSRAKGTTRSLIHIPIVHTQTDMGGLGQAVQAATIQKLGQEGWERNVTLIDKIWDSIEQAIESWSLPYPQVRLYQDGLPVCGRELEIVTEIARIGSRNHQLLLRLQRHGATIMGTESADLLLKEYKLIKQVLQAPNPAEAARLESRQKKTSDSLLKQRDQFIAERINRTLGAGETGVLFLGMLHSVAPFIAADIDLTQTSHLASGAGSQKNPERR